MNIDENKVRSVIEDACKIAGSFIKLMAFDELKVFKTRGTTEEKGKFLSIFDREAERLIRNTITMYYPDSTIFTDAQKGEEIQVEKEGLTWFIDPIDGTKAFLKGQFSFVAMSIAAWDKDGLIAGGIYNPFTEMLYSASRSSDCFLNSEPLPRPNPTSKTEARVLIDFAKDIPDNIKLGLTTADLRDDLGRVLRFDGSIAQHLALIAQGTLDGAIIWGTGTKGAYWDLAAALMLLHRQNIKVTGLSGEEITPKSPSFDQLAIAEPKLHNELLEWVEVIKKFKYETDKSGKKRRFFGIF